MPAPVYRKNLPTVNPPKGRPCLLTAERENRFLQAIEAGLPIKQAAMMAGVSYETVNRWKKRGEAENAPPEFRHFWQALQLSEAKCMQYHLGKIVKASDKDWKASAYFIEKRFPDDFGKAAKIEAPANPYLPVEIEPEVLKRIRKQNSIVEQAGKFAKILEQIRADKEKAAESEEEDFPDKWL